VVFGPAIGSGGYINYVTKKPSFDKQHTSITIRGGAIVPDGQSRGSYTITADTSAPLTDNLAYRISATLQRQQDYYYNVDNNYNAIYGALAWKPTSKLRIDANFSYDDYYDWNITHGWNRPTQSLVDNQLYLSGRATPIFRNNGVLWSPVYASGAANSAIVGWQQRAASSNGAYTTYPVVAGSLTTTNPNTQSSPGTVVGFVLDPANTSLVPISRQASQRAADQNTSLRATGQVHIAYDFSPRTSLVNHFFYEHSTDTTNAVASFQSNARDDLFEDRLELHHKLDFNAGGIDISDETNSGVIVRHEVNYQVSANNSFFFINAYDISLDQASEQGKNPGSLFGVVGYNPAGGNAAWIGTAGVPQQTAFGYVNFNPMYPQGNGLYGEANAIYTGDAHITTTTLYTEHNLRFGRHLGLDAGYSHSWVSASTFNPFQQAASGTQAAVGLRYYSGSYSNLFALQLSPFVKPTENTTLYFTYDHSLAINSGPFSNTIIQAPLSTAQFNSNSVLYETGFKASFLRGKAWFTAAYYDQARDQGLDPTTNTISRLHVHGVESSLRYQPNETLRTGANFTWLKARYDYTTTSGFATQGIFADNATVFSDAGLNSSYSGPLDAGVLPAYTVSGYIDYRHRSGFGAELSGKVTSPWWLNASQTVRIPTNYNLDLGLFYRQKRWSLQVQVLNLTNTLGFVPGLSGVTNTFLQPTRGREIFAQLGFNF
jgi:hypothetical protein